MGTSLEIFFTGKYFRIPNYQRDYAWDMSNVDDLLDDIIEAIETNTSHYIGTFILSKTQSPNIFNVVDGQQRLTTLVMLFNVAIREFGTQTDQIIYGDKFKKSQNDGLWRLELLNSNQAFFQEMLEGKQPTPNTKSQTLLLEAYNRIDTRICALKASNGMSSLFLDAIKQLEVMEFIESDDGKAIRMFQTVNDRGKPLSNVEKAKSLLIYYSNRFLGGSLDAHINSQFGMIFQNFTEIKTIGDKYKIDAISQKRFTEDSVMRYHFLSFADELYDFNATENYVLDVYLKGILKPLRGEAKKLEKFIRDYTDDLEKFFQNFVNILRRVATDCTYYKIFPILDISARLYPLMVRLEMRGLLTYRIPQVKNMTILDLLEIADVRVYKIRGTDPRADMAYLAKDAKRLAAKEILSKLHSFVDYFMNDAEFARRLNSDVYPNPVLRHLITEFSEYQRKQAYTLSELLAQTDLFPTVEHIFAQEQTFSFPDFGFQTLEEYNDRVHMLGNLTLLEKNINSQCRNKTPSQKVSDNLYGRSVFDDAKKISADVMNTGNPLKKADIEKRTKIIADFSLKRWRYK
jgi:uncharacterized protein with ParB-like and HNH nuclease domain